MAARLITERAAPHRAAAATYLREAPRGGAYILSVEFFGDEHWRATVVQRAYDSLVASVEQMRHALDLKHDTKAILDDIRKVLHAEARKQPGRFLWIGTDEFELATAGGLTVLQALYDAFNQTNDEPPEYFVHAIQDFMIVRDGKTPTRKVHNTARNAWRDDPGANRRIRERESLSPGESFRSPYRSRPEKYEPDVVLAFERAIAKAIGRPRISWTRGKGHLDHGYIPDHASRGVVLDVLVATVEWAMCVAWQCCAPPGSKPPEVKAGGILGILKAKRPLTNSTD